MRLRGPGAPAGHGAGPPEERSLTRLAVRFVGSFPHPDLSLDPQLPEIAFVGRSNVGKSSLINALVGARVARVSATPGKTRMLNVYLLSEQGAGSREQGGRPPAPRSLLPLCYLVDLPGYGYAAAPHQERRAWRRLVRRYLTDRPALAGVVWLLDGRHHPSTDDLAMPKLFAASGVPVLAAVTKADKVPRGQRLGRLSSLGETLELDEEQMITTSARTGEGIEDLEAAIRLLASGEPAA